MEMSSSPRKSARSTTFNTAVRGKERIWTICGASISDTKLAQSVVSYATVILVVAFGSAYAALALSRPLQPIHEIPAQADPDVEATRQFDQNVNLVRLNFTSTQIDARQGNRGWMLNPIHTAATAGLQGGSLNCKEVHLGEILPGQMRGNHRHHHCNETFILWGAKQKLRMENLTLPNGYGEVTIGASEVAVVAGPVNLAHAVFNLDETKTSYLLACQDAEFDSTNPRTDYKVWPDIK